MLSTVFSKALAELSPFPKAFELPNMIQVLVDRIVNLIEPLLDLRRHL